MLADFVITIYNARKPLTVQVKVHENTATLRLAAKVYAERYGRKGDSDFSSVLGMCHRFHINKDPLCAIVRLAPPYLGIGIISHELAHVAVWMREIENKFEDVPLTCADDEWFCWVLGELVRFTIVKLYDHGVYSASESSIKAS
jgi:hypothetical protein